MRARFALLAFLPCFPPLALRALLALSSRCAFLARDARQPLLSDVTLLPLFAAFAPQTLRARRSSRPDVAGKALKALIAGRARNAGLARGSLSAGNARDAGKSCFAFLAAFARGALGARNSGKAVEAWRSLLAAWTLNAGFAAQALRTGLAARAAIAAVALRTRYALQASLAVKPVSAGRPAFAVAHERQALGHGARTIVAQIENLGAQLRDDRLRLRVEQLARPRVLALPNALLLGNDERQRFLQHAIGKAAVG